MEWVTRMDMDMEWISGGYGCFFVKSFGVGVDNGVKIPKCLQNTYCPYAFLTV